MTFHEVMDSLTDDNGYFVYSRDWCKGYLYALVEHNIIDQGIYDHIIETLAIINKI